MTKQQFDALTVGTILKSGSGKFYRVQVSIDNALEPSGHYAYVVRCNEQGTREGLTNREKACGSALRNHTGDWTVVAVA